jgi:hypothetical protein
MKIRTSYFVLAGFFILYLAARLFFSLQSDYFNSDSSYFALREIEYIAKTGRPLIHDTLSYSGRDLVFMPFYYYFMAFFQKIFPGVIALKVVNSFFASLIVPALYLCVHKLVKDSKVAVVSAIVGGLSPFYLALTLNDITGNSIIIPGMICLFYLLMRLDEDISILNYLIPLTLVIVLCSSSVFLIILTLGVFFLILYTEKIAIKKIILEFSAFFLLFFFWTNFIIYKTAFQKHGFSIISGNISAETVRQYFNLDMVQTFLSIGIITSILGIYTVYLYIAGKKRQDVMLFISFFFSGMLLFLSGLVEIDLAMAFLSLSLVILSSRAITDIFDIVDKSKVAAQANKIFLLSVAFLIIVQGLPGILAFPGVMKKSLTSAYVSDLTWIKENTPKDSVIAATISEGNLITYFSERKNIADTNYLLSDSPEERTSDINKIFRTVLKVDAIKVLEKYGSEYVLFSEIAKKEYSIEELRYVNDSCFKLVLDREISLYQKDEKCRLKSYEN